MPPTKTKSQKNPARQQGFRFRKDKVHLTYKTHVDPQKIIERFDSLGGGHLWYSIVHEVGKSKTQEGETATGLPSELRGVETSDEGCEILRGTTTDASGVLPGVGVGDGDGAGDDSGDLDVRDGYDHTHVAFCWKRTLDTSNPRYFDIESGGETLHPNIKYIATNKHACNIWRYHEKDGVPVRSATSPITLATTIKRIVEAASLYDACEEMGIQAKTVSDIKLLRADVPKAKPYQHRYPDAEWLLKPPENFRCLYVWGGTGCGKTQWALHQFERPLLVRSIDTLKTFNPSYHDGLVFDDIDFSARSAVDCIMLTEWDEDAPIKARFTDAHIPAGTRKIFCSNMPFDENFPMDKAGAIRRRIGKIIHVSGPLFRSSAWTPEQLSAIREATKAAEQGAHDGAKRRRVDLDVLAAAEPAPEDTYVYRELREDLLVQHNAGPVDASVPATEEANEEVAWETLSGMSAFSLDM